MFFLCGGILLFMLLFGVWSSYYPSRESAFRRFPSPSGTFEVLAYTKAGTWSFATPGQGGAGRKPGYFILMDRQNKILLRGNIGMLDSFGVSWGDDEEYVRIRGYGRWYFPISPHHGYTITKKAMSTMNALGVPQPILDQLQRLENIQYLYEPTFLMAVEQTIGKEALIQYREIILSSAKSSKNDANTVE